ncbi:MAG: hypothetical protein QGG40_22420 [Myxococcota bacterium]|nr:hypothetical protein [Myxococcota bacterium]
MRNSRGSIEAMTAPLIIAGALLAGPPALAAEQPTEATMERWWGEATGLMAGIAVIHGVQPLAAAAGQVEWTDKFYVSTAGFGLYTASAIGIGMHEEWGLYIAIGGPALGFSSIMTGYALSEIGVLDTDIQPDAFQLAGAMLQVPCAIRSWQILKHEPHRGTARLQPYVATHTMGITGRF